jgi:hypothetical protein
MFGCWRLAVTSTSRRKRGAQYSGQVGSEHLHRDPSAVLEVFSQIHRRHATTTQFPLDGIAVGQGLPHLLASSGVVNRTP